MYSDVMPYHVLPLTMAQVREGALGFQRQLSRMLHDVPAIKVYSVSPFDLDERRRVRERFGGDVVYFFNDAAKHACEESGSYLHYIAEIPDEQLPKRRSLIVGTV
jgi:hypothetical protein